MRLMRSIWSIMGLTPPTQGQVIWKDRDIAGMPAFKIARDGIKPVWPLVLTGLIGIIAGIAALVWPGMTAFVLLMFIAAWAIVVGVLQVAAAIRIRKEIDNEWMLILSGVVSILFGALMILSPGRGAVALVWVIASYSIVFDLLLVVLAFEMRGLKPEDQPGIPSRFGT